MSHHWSKGLPFFLVLSTVFLVALAGTIVAADDDQKPYSKCWEYSASADLSTAASADVANLYFLNLDNQLEAVELKTHSRVWSTDVRGSVTSNLLLSDSSVILAATVTATIGPPKSFLRSVSKETGVTQWTAEIKDDSIIAIGRGSSVVIAIMKSGVVSAFSESTGAQIWTTTLRSKLSTEPQFFRDGVIVSGENNEIVRVNWSSGEMVTILRMSRQPTAVYLDDSGRVLSGDDRGNLTLTSRDGDQIWKFKNGARISFILPYDSEYLATSFDNFFYKFTRSGGVEWKRRLPGRVAERPLIIGDEAIATVSGDESVFVIDLRNGKIVNRIESGLENATAKIVNAAGVGFAVMTPERISFYRRDACTPK